MSYCPYCGTQLSSEMRYCPSCGAAVGNLETVYEVTETASAGTGNYQIFITDLGSCTANLTADLLEDILGYAPATALKLANSVPVQIASDLSLKQAAVVAQAFEEYGLKLAVTAGDDYADISSSTSASSVFNSDGSLIASAAIILASISAANRMRTINRPKKPSLAERLFHSLFGPKKPPVHVRRTIRPRNTRPPVNDAPKRSMSVRQQVYAPRHNEPGGNKGPQGGSHHGPQGGPQRHDR